MELLSSIERHLTGMQAHGDVVDHYLEALESWYAAVFTFTAPWQTRNVEDRQIVDSRDLRLLRALAGAIDSLRLVQPLVEAQVLGIFETLEDAEQAVRLATDIDESTRRYLLGLIVEARKALRDWQTFGPEPARRVCLELGGALYTLAEQSPQATQKETWRTTARAITVQVLSGAATQGVIAGTTEAIKSLQ